MENKNFIDEILSEMFRGTNEILLNEADTNAITMAKQDLSNEFERHMQDKKAADQVRRDAKNYGVTLDRGAERNAERNRILGANPETDVIPKGSYEKAVKSMSQDLKDALKASNIISNPNTPKEVRSELLKKWGGYGGLQRYRDMADKISLTPAYDQKNAREAGINNAPFGTNYIAVSPSGNDYLTSKKPQSKPELVNKDGKVTRPFVPADKVIGYDFENLDLTQVRDKDIIDYFKTGTRQDHKYDEETGEDTNPNKGLTYKELAEIAGDEKDARSQRAMADLKNLYFKAMFNKLLNSKFGYDFKMPTAMYTYGNAKLPKDTLVVNFTSAHRCPAWSECLVGYACYARGSEHNYEGLHRKNTNLNLMWSSAQHDEKLLESMFKVIKMHLINPANMATSLLNDPTTYKKWIKILSDKNANFTPLTKDTINAMKPKTMNTLAMPGKNDSAEDDEMELENKSLLGAALNEATGKTKKTKNPKNVKKPLGARDNLAGLIYTHSFDELFDKKDLKVIRKNPNSFRAKFIRLNEEGDFIGDWLLKAFDKFAGELKLVGITTAAYTCRNLNFDSVENIIINASTIKVGTNHETTNPEELERYNNSINKKAKDLGIDRTENTSKAIARRFFAISESLYDSLEDTYVPTGRKLRYKIPEDVKKGEYDGSKPLVPLHKTKGGLHVKYDLKPYTNDKDTSNPVTYNDIHDANGITVKRRLYYKCPCGRHGDVLGENGKPLKMDCYLCRMCYEPKDENVGEIYVLVEVHGDNIDSFDMEKANNARGITNSMATYKEAKAIFANRLCEEHMEAEKQGLELVTENVINSIKDHIQQIGNEALSSLETETKNFKNIMTDIEEADKKRGNTILD